MNYGLKELPEDDRDFQLGAVFSLPALKELPNSYTLAIVDVKDQGNTDMCTSYASCLLSEIQEAVPLEPSFTFAMSKELSGDIFAWGQDLRTICKAHQKYGALEVSDSPYSLETKDSDFLRDPSNWPETLRNKAISHRKKSYFKVVGPYDTFDNIRASIFKFKAKGQGVLFGVLWGWPTNQVYIDVPSQGGSGHALGAIGWDGDYLLVPNSCGTKAGRNGHHYIHRNVINEYADKFGAFMLVDMDKEDAEYYIENGIKADWSWVKQLVYAFINLFKRIWRT